MVYLCKSTQAIQSRAPWQPGRGWLNLLKLHLPALVSLHIYFPCDLRSVFSQHWRRTIHGQSDISAHFLHPFNYLPLLRPLMPFCLTDSSGSVALDDGNLGVVTKSELIS